MLTHHINPVALRKAKIAYNFGISECNRVKQNLDNYEQTQKCQPKFMILYARICKIQRTWHVPIHLNFLFRHTANMVILNVNTAFIAF